MRSGVTRDCLRRMGKTPVNRETYTIVVIIGRIVADIFMRKVGIGLRLH